MTPYPPLRPALSAGLAGLVGLALAASAEPLPAPAELLKDFDSIGVIQISVPPAPSAEKDPSGNPVVEAGVNLMIPMRQAYVRPDRVYVELLLGTRQLWLTQGDTERAWSPGMPYIIERSYRNLTNAAENPMVAAQLSMATYARLLSELQTAKLLPDEDLAKVEEQQKKRQADLMAERDRLKRSTDPNDVPKAQDVTSELARVKDDLDQIPFRREHPCRLVEVDNRDLARNLLAQGLMGERAAKALQGGRTRFWVTKGEGLPVRMETVDGEGRVTLYAHLSRVRINQGLHPGELTLGAPPGTRLIRVSADMRDRNWQQKMDRDLSEQLEAIEKERQQKSQPALPRKGRG